MKKAALGRRGCGTNEGMRDLRSLFWFALWSGGFGYAAWLASHQAEVVAYVLCASLIVPMERFFAALGQSVSATEALRLRQRLLRSSPRARKPGADPQH